MTCETVRRRVALFVATQTPSHCQRRSLNSCVHPRDVAMTRLTIHAGQHMAFVREPDEVGQIVHAYPGDRLLLFPEPEYLDDLRLVGCDGQVALGAPLNRWKTGDRTAARIGMAQLTRNRILSRVEPMTEFDRLCGFLSAKAAEKCEQSAERDHDRRRTQPIPHLTAAIILRENPGMNRNGVAWFLSAIVVLGLAVLAVLFGLHLVPPRETALAKGTIVPWYLVWGMICITAAMAVFLAGFVATTAFNSGKAE